MNNSGLTTSLLVLAIYALAIAALVGALTPYTPASGTLRSYAKHCDGESIMSFARGEAEANFEQCAGYSFIALEFWVSESSQSVQIRNASRDGLPADYLDCFVANVENWKCRATGDQWGTIWARDGRITNTAEWHWKPISAPIYWLSRVLAFTDALIER